MEILLRHRLASRSLENRHTGRLKAMVMLRTLTRRCQGPLAGSWCRPWRDEDNGRLRGREDVGERLLAEEELLW